MGFEICSENGTAQFHRDYEPSVLQGTAAVLVILGLVSVVENGITVVALVICPKLRNPTTVFVVNLAVADLLFSAVETPMIVIWCLSEDGLWVLENIGCSTYVYLSHMFISVALCSMAGIGVTRLVVIICNRKPGCKLFHWKFVTAGLVACWLLPGVSLVFPLLGVWGRIGPNRLSIGGCSLLPTDSSSSKTTIYAIGIIGPILCMGTCYCLIFLFVYRHRKHLPAESKYLKEARSRALSLDIPQAPNLQKLQRQSEDIDCFQFSRQFSVRSFTRVVFGTELRLTQVMGVTYIAVVLCFVPTVLAEIFDAHICHTTLNLLVAIPVWINGCLNPIIYSIMSRQYRQAYVNLLESCGKLSRR